MILNAYAGLDAFLALLRLGLGLLVLGLGGAAWRAWRSRSAVLEERKALEDRCYLLFLLAGLLLNRVRPAPFLPRPLARAAGWSLTAAGMALAAWFITTMRRAGTPVDPREPVRRIVTDGPFRFSRNPG